MAVSAVKENKVGGSGKRLAAGRASAVIDEMVIDDLSAEVTSDKKCE